MIDTSEIADMIAATLKNDPIESTEPELPIDNTELRERMLNTDELADARELM